VNGESQPHKHENRKADAVDTKTMNDNVGREVNVAMDVARNHKEPCEQNQKYVNLHRDVSNNAGDVE